jgi:hypothetical protein
VIVDFLVVKFASKISHDSTNRISGELCGSNFPDCLEDGIWPAVLRPIVQALRADRSPTTKKFFELFGFLEGIVLFDDVSPTGCAHSGQLLDGGGQHFAHSLCQRNVVA